MKLNAYTKVIVFEDENGEEMVIRHGCTWLKMTTYIRKDAYIGSVTSLNDDSLTLSYEGDSKLIYFTDIIEVRYFNPNTELKSL